jgi:hypothetical protein
MESMGGRKVRGGARKVNRAVARGFQEKKEAPRIERIKRISFEDSPDLRRLN